MADSDKDIIITPNTGQASSDPNIEFSSGASVAGNPISLTVTDDGTTTTLDFSGNDVGQLFSISNTLDGNLFTVSDTSGIPLIAANSDATVKLNEFAGNLLIGTSTDDGTNKVQISGNAIITGQLSFSSGTSTAINVANRTITGIGNLIISDPGANEGITWNGGNLWKIYESPNDLSNNGGNLQIVENATRRATFTSGGGLEVVGNISATNSSGTNTGDQIIQTTSPVSGGSASAGADVTISLATGYGDTQNPYGSKTAKHFLAAPNASAGNPSFRAIVASDIPTLNQDTTGNAGTVTNGVYTTGNQTIGGTKTFSSTISGSIDGNAATATNVAYSGLTGTVPTWNQNTTGTASNVTGTVAVANGGTGATSATANRVPYWTSTSALGSASNFTYDGTTLNVGAITSAGLITQGNTGIRVGTKDDLTTRFESGFWQTNTATTAEAWPTTSNNWYHLIASTHNNTGNYYSMQFAGDFFDSDELYYRAVSQGNTNAINNTNEPWYKVYHEGNFGVVTGTLIADVIAANEIYTDMLAANAITANKIAAGAVTANQLQISNPEGSTAAGIVMSYNSGNPKIVIRDSSGTVRVKIGYLL